MFCLSNYISYSTYRDSCKEIFTLYLQTRILISIVNEEGKSFFRTSVLISTGLHREISLITVLSKSYFGQISKNARTVQKEIETNDRKEGLPFKETLWISFHLLITCGVARRKKEGTEIIMFNLAKIKNSETIERNFFSSLLSCRSKSIITIHRPLTIISLFHTILHLITLFFIKIW